MGMMISQPVFDNYHKFEKEFGLTLLEFIRKGNVYTAEEIMEVVEDSEMENMHPTQILAALRMWKTGQYGCKLSTRPTSPTVRMTNFDALMQIANAGLPIPPEALMEYVDIPNKEKILESMRQSQQQKQQMEQMQMMMQMQSGRGQGSPPNPRGNPSPPKNSPTAQNV